LSADASIQLVPYGDDPLRYLARLLHERHRDRLPDLSRHVVLFPHAGAVPRFRRILLKQAAQDGHAALLPPYIGVLSAWARRHASEQQQALSETAREILLRDLLGEIPSWSRQYHAWPLVDSLLALFDELTLHRCELPGEPAGLLPRIAKNLAAQMDEASPFIDEARLVQALWNAWRARLAQNHWQDPPLQITDGLRRSLDNLPQDSHFYLAGFVDFTRAELEWMKTLRAQGRLTLVRHGRGAAEYADSAASFRRAREAAPGTEATPDAYAAFLDRVFADDAGALARRAREQRSASRESPARGRLTIHEAADAESEARAIDLQVRRWLLEGRRDIGIVTSDRRLARRVRALLERANIGLLDAGGWTLSTTSAATALARWLECLEQRFAHGPLLDLLKSPFLQLGWGRAELDRLVPWFEQHVVRERNIAAGLDNYLFGLNRVRAGLEARAGLDVVDALEQLLHRIQTTAAELLELTHGRPRAALEFLEALRESLMNLGLAPGFENDDAGRELLDVLEEMRVAAIHSGLRLSWTEFHEWLKRKMEQRRFHPPMNGRGVELMGFAESRLYRYDALIIAGSLREHLPGRVGAPAYFNDAVRTELGLPSLARRYASQFYDFRRLLEAAPRVLISLHAEHEGEPLAPSPWVERLRAFHELAYRETLADPALDWLVQQPGTMIADRTAELPSPQNPPAARLPAALVPAVLSATDHQRLIDCPYQFFAACGLGLTPEKEVQEEIEKSDFGKHVHRILQAFHTGVPGLPGPWRQPLDETAMPQAQTLLDEISQAVFAADLRRRFTTRAWLYRWQRCIPAYLEWERKRAARWKVQATETRKQRDHCDGGTCVSIVGRIDRMDRGAEGVGLVDYKTGAPPSRDLVLQGESIQLPFYALLLDGEVIAQALFLSLQDGEVAEKVVLESETIARLYEAVRQRMILLQRRLGEEAPLPAWGDAETCRVCAMEGLCRREMWLQADPANAGAIPT
jgi:ATP-dependent helicase/nuclease subunit B